MVDARLLGSSRFALVFLGCLQMNCMGAPGVAPSPSGDAASTEGDTTQPAADATSGDVVTSPTPDAETVSPIQIGDSGLPTLPPLTNLSATVRDDAVSIDFDPVDGAIDYRVYPLPTNPEDITVHSDGSVTIRNAIYRCAGKRQTMDIGNNLNMGDTSLVTPSWTAQIPSNPIIGYVYVTPATGRTPVYAVAGQYAGNENGWRESRLKVYTTDPSEQQMLLSQGWRDDGIVFYVPSAATATTQTVYASQDVQMGPGFPFNQRYYFLASDLSTHMQDTMAPAPAFQVLTSMSDDARPLYATFLTPQWQSHTELSVGPERFHRAAYQGNGPNWHVEWAGITQSTVLVVEALSSGCPFQGFLAAHHVDGNASGGAPENVYMPPHQTFYTLSDLQTGSPTGEVFVNGEYDTTTLPTAVARSFIQVAPNPPNPGDWDWYDGFNVGSDLGQTTTIPNCLEGGGPGSGCIHWQTANYDISGYRLDWENNAPVFTYGSFMGQLWSTFDDNAQDVTGKVRFTPLQMATVSSDPNQYLHVTMSVNIPSDARRYPQLMISDQPPPVQEGLSNPNNNTLIIQPINGPSMQIEAQAIHGLVNGNEWDVNNQSPSHVFIRSGYMDNLEGAPPSPVEPAFEHSGVDRMTQFDVFVSSQRMYLFLDGTPAGCSAYPSPFVLQGSVTVTFGDVLYHEAAPDDVCGNAEEFSFSHFHNCIETDRRFDNIGFKSNVPPPTWNESLLPCGPY